MELKELNSNIEIIKNKYAKYSDKNGNIVIFPIAGLICKCEYLRVDETNKNILEFRGEIPKGMKFTKIKTMTQVTKDKITGKEEDKNTIVDQDVEVFEMWKVTNSVGISEIFNNKDEATKYCDKINEKYLEMI